MGIVFDECKRAVLHRLDAASKSATTTTAGILSTDRAYSDDEVNASLVRSADDTMTTVYASDLHPEREAAMQFTTLAYAAQLPSHSGKHGLILVSNTGLDADYKPAYELSLQGIVTRNSSPVPRTLGGPYYFVAAGGYVYFTRTSGSARAKVALAIWAGGVDDVPRRYKNAVIAGALKSLFAQGGAKISAAQHYRAEWTDAIGLVLQDKEPAEVKVWKEAA